MRPSILALENHRAKRGQHPGLLLQRYACRSTVGQEGSDEKRALLQSAIQASKDMEVRSLYAATYTRWTGLPRNIHESAILQTDGRLIVGLGSENILETGIRLHHTYGVPVLPGSALKGLAAHFCSTVWGAEVDQCKRDSAYHKLLFGATDESGCIIFHDGWITPDSHDPLRIDVMTPHHPEWADGNKTPTDFDSPIPIPFLSVEGKFYVSVTWNGPDSEHASAWTLRAMEILKLALTDWGIGGKTSSGYGRLVDPASLQKSTTGHSTQVAASLKVIPKSGDKVIAILEEAKTGKGGWKARHLPSDLTGPIQNSIDVPAGCEAGHELTLIVALSNQQSIAFRYPTAAEEARAAKKPKGDGNQNSNRRR